MSPEVEDLLVVPATIDLAGAEIELVSVVARESRLRKAIHGHPLVGSAAEVGADRFDYVLVDCPPSLGLLTLNALVAGSEMLIPIQAEYYALEGLGQLLETVEMVKAHQPDPGGLHHPGDDVRRPDPARRGRGRGGPRALRRPGAQDHHPRSVRVSEAPSYGQTVMTYDPGRRARCPTWRQREIATKGAPPHEHRQPSATAPRTRPRSGFVDPDRAQPGAGRRRDPWGAAGGTATAGATGDLAPVAGAYFAEIPVGRIAPNRAQPRQVFDEEAMAELVHSIREIGVLQPVVVRRRGDADHELVMGERRWRAAQEAGLEAVPAIVRGDRRRRHAPRRPAGEPAPVPAQPAGGGGRLPADARRLPGCTHGELAARIGRSRPQISNTLRLLACRHRRFSVGSLGGSRPGTPGRCWRSKTRVQDRLAQRVVAEGISVRGLEEIVAVRDLDAPTPRVTRRKPVAPGLVDLADRLSDRFETRVKVDLGRTKGRITVEFASLDDLQRIVDIMDPQPVRPAHLTGLSDRAIRPGRGPAP